MVLRFVLALVFFFASNCLAVQAEEYNENLVVDMQAGNLGWHLDNTTNGPSNVMQEYVPAGQTGQHWSDMITIMTFTNHPEIRMDNLVVKVVERLKGTCAKVTILSKDVKQQTDSMRQSRGLPANYNAFSVLVRCDSPDPAKSPPSAPLKKYEVIMFKGIQGWLNAYLVQRAWHGDVITPDSILASQKTLQDWQSWADQVGISGSPDARTP